MADRKQRERPRDDRDEQQTERRSSSSRSNGQRRPKVSGPKVAGRAAQELLQLTGKDIEGIVGLERVDGAWKVEVEVLEVRRIPDTTDVLALYEVDADADGSLIGYRRLRRYGRGSPGQDGDTR